MSEFQSNKTTPDFLNHNNQPSQQKKRNLHSFPTEHQPSRPNSIEIASISIVDSHLAMEDYQRLEKIGEGKSNPFITESLVVI